MKPDDFQAKVILASCTYNSYDPPIFTIQARYPRMIHSEVITHRVFSRNARSSRAVPVSKLLQEEIYVPHFMKNQAGMQSFEEFDLDELKEIENKWIRFAEETQKFSKWLSDKGVHKQWANRPVEWFGYIDTIITSTEWDNFFSLRLHKDAMPEIKELALSMDKEIRKVIDECKLQKLKNGEWHIPYVSLQEDFELETILKLSVARCARISYSPFDGNASLEKEFKRYELLKQQKHWSPFEHQAKVADKNDIWTYDFGLESNLSYPWVQYRKLVELEEK
jgi:thymidylate synthase ThyX